MRKKFLIRHLGNVGDMIFFIPPVFATLKRRYPDCHITFVTAWGFKDKRGRWGKRNQDGFSIHLIMTNPHIDTLIHWHDTAISLSASICHEDGKNFVTWNRRYYEQQKQSGNYTDVFELDFGLACTDNPIQRMYQAIGLPEEGNSDYKINLTEKDRQVAEEVIGDAPRPRIVLLESIEGTTTRGWDPGKIPFLEKAIEKKYGAGPLWFGSRHIPEYHGRPVTFRENIAWLALCDAAIGVLSGPLHFAAAVGLSTLTLYCDAPLHRAAPAYFLNPYTAEQPKKHRTLLGPSGFIPKNLKSELPSDNLTPAEIKTQNFTNWTKPGRQATKSCLSVITVDEIMTVLQEIVSPVTTTSHGNARKRAADEGEINY